MLTRRIIPCLDVLGGRVVKGVNFINLRDAGDPAELARTYMEEGADELVFLDITASAERRRTMLEWVSQVADTLFLPFTVGGGISTVEDMETFLALGAEDGLAGPAALHQRAQLFHIRRKARGQAIHHHADSRRVGLAEHTHLDILSKDG